MAHEVREESAKGGSQPRQEDDQRDRADGTQGGDGEDPGEGDGHDGVTNEGEDKGADVAKLGQVMEGVFVVED